MTFNSNGPQIFYDDAYYGGVAVPVGQFNVALYWGVLDTPEDSLIPIKTTTIRPLDGRFLGGVVTTPDMTAPATYATFQIRAWSVGYTTYEDALAFGNDSTFVGKCPVFESFTGGVGTPPAPPPPLNFESIRVSPVPEPSAAITFLVGLTGLLLSRSSRSR